MPKNLHNIILDQLQKVENEGTEIPQELIENIGIYLNPDDQSSMEELAEILCGHIKKGGLDTVKKVLGVLAQDDQGKMAVSGLIQKNIWENMSLYHDALEVVGNLLRDVVVEVPKLKELKSPEDLGSEELPVVYTTFMPDIAPELQNLDVEELGEELFDGDVSSYYDKAEKVFFQAQDCMRNNEMADALKCFTVATDLMGTYVDQVEPTDSEISDYITMLFLAAISYTSIDTGAKAVEFTDKASKLAQELFERNPTAENADLVLSALHHYLVFSAIELDPENALLLCSQILERAESYAQRFPDYDFSQVTSQIELAYADYLYSYGDKTNAFRLFDKVLGYRKKRVGEVKSFYDVFSYYKGLQIVGNILLEGGDNVPAGSYFLESALILREIPTENLTWDNLINMRNMFDKAARCYDEIRDHKNSLMVNQKTKDVFESYLKDGIALPHTLIDIVFSLEGVLANTYRLYGSPQTILEEDWYEAVINELKDYAQLGLALFPEDESVQYTYRRGLDFVDQLRSVL